MYINELKVKFSKLKNTIILIIGIIGLIIFGSTFIFVIIEEQTTEMIIIFGVITILSGLLIYKSIKSIAIIESIYFYSRFFEGDLDGYINTSDMIQVIGKSETKINTELYKLLKKKYMTNFILKKTEKGMQVILDSKISKCECKNCGAIIDKRVYFTGVCPYCGSSDLFAKLIK